MLTIKVGTTTGGYGVTVFSDGYDFHAAIASLKVAIPRWFRTFDGHRREWVVADEAEAELREWVREMRESCGAKVVGDAFQDEPRQRRKSNGRGRPRKGTDESYEVLHLRETAPVGLVRAARKVLAREAHPDAGGSEESMKRINAAADAILSRLGAA